jgi:hypothetical protein
MITDTPNVARNLPKFLYIVVIITNFGHYCKLRFWKAPSVLIMKVFQKQEFLIRFTECLTKFL